MSSKQVIKLPDDIELSEWLESMESLLQAEGPDRAKAVFRALRDYLTDANVIVEDANEKRGHQNRDGCAF